MPWGYVIDKERRLVRSACWGYVIFADAKAHQDQLSKDPDFVPDFNQLLDLTGVTTLEISTEEAKTIARGTLFFSPPSRRAWVASDPLVFGMARLVEAYREMAGAREEFRVFYDRAEALKWLGIDGDVG